MNDMPHRVLRHDTGPPEPDRSRPYRSGTFGVLDIGTTKIACLIARVDSDGEVRVLGCDWRQGLGVRGGSIVDLEKAERAIRAEGLEPIREPIRGGTDGSRLSEMGLLTPNIFDGGHEYHSVREWASVQDMACAAATIVRLAGIWAARVPSG